MLSAMISKMAISSTLSMLTTCTVELVSDEKKKICAFSTIVWARIWLLTAPFVGATIVFGQLVPQTAFASLSILGGILTMMISSPRTIPKKKTHIDLSTDSNYNANIQMGNNTPFKKDKSDLPPPLAPGIWTTKSQDIGARI
uniref:Uncharacterized protein n=1 Tax=Megaselia scalaris TaxID=36166 RepID=T1GSP4_MEGSC